MCKWHGAQKPARPMIGTRSEVCHSTPKWLGGVDFCNLRESCVPRVISTNECVEVPDFAMDHVSNGDLFDHIRRLGRFSIQDTRFYAAELLLALVGFSVLVHTCACV